MVVNQKSTGRAVSMPAGLAVGLGVSAAITVLMAAIAAYLQGGEVLGENGVGYFAMLTLLISSVVGAMTAAGKVKHMRMAVCLLSGICYLLLLIGTTALFFGGQYEGVGVTAAVVLGAALAAVFLQRKDKRSTSVRIKKLKNR